MDRIELFHNLVNLAACDGKFMDAEIQFLANRADLWDVPKGQFEAALAQISEGNFEIKIPENHGERINLMKEILRLIASDGELADMEKHICSLVAGRMNLSGAEFDRILQSVIAEAS